MSTGSRRTILLLRTSETHRNSAASGPQVAVSKWRSRIQGATVAPVVDIGIEKRIRRKKRAGARTNGKKCRGKKKERRDARERR